MNQKISLSEYIDTHLLGSAQDHPIAYYLTGVESLQYQNNTIIYGIIGVPKDIVGLSKEQQEGGWTKISKDLSQCLDGENLGNWIMLAEPSIPDYQRFLNYIAIQAYEENNSEKSIKDIEKSIVDQFNIDQNFNKDDLIDFLIARQAFLKGKLVESGKSPYYYNDVANTIDWLETII